MIVCKGKVGVYEIMGGKGCWRLTKMYPSLSSDYTPTLFVDFYNNIFIAACIAFFMNILFKLFIYSNANTISCSLVLESAPLR